MSIDLDWAEELGDLPDGTITPPDLTRPTEDLDLSLFFANGFVRNYSNVARILQHEIWIRQVIAERMENAARWAPEGCLWVQI